MSQVWTSLILPHFSEESSRKTLQIITTSLNPSTSTSPSQSTPSSLNQLTPTSPSVTIQPAITSNSKHLSFLFRNVFFVVQLNAQGCLTLFGSCPYLGMLYLIITP